MHTCAHTHIRTRIFQLLKTNNLKNLEAARGRKNIYVQSNKDKLQ